MKKQIFTLLTLLLCVCSGAWADPTYYTPDADEVIILNDVYSSTATTTGYSTHTALVWYSNAAKWASKKAGDPNNGGAQTSSNVSCFQIKNNGDNKRVDVNISGVSKLIVYRESSSNKVRLLDKNNSNSEIANDGGNVLYYEFTLDGTQNYSIRLEGNDGSSQQDVNVYAIKLIKYGASKTPSDLTITSGTTLLLEKNATSTITHTTSSTGAITYSTANAAVATVSAGVITAQGGGKTKITVSQASDETYAAGSKVVDVNVPYDNPAAADTYTLSSPELSFSNDTKTKHYFTNGFTITTSAEDGMQYAGIESNTGIKYSHVRTYTINTPSNVTATYLEIKARNNYPTGGTEANWGTVLGTDYSEDALPYSDEEPQTRYFQIASPAAGADLSFTPGGNQWQGYITVHTNAWVDATGVGLNKTSTSIGVGYTETLTATLAPATASNQNISWTSSDTDVATVANGIVTAVAEGSATITATTEDGSFTATCDVTVILPIVTLPTGSKSGYSLTGGTTKTYSRSGHPFNSQSVYEISNGGNITLTVPSTTQISKILVRGTSDDNSNNSTITITGANSENASGTFVNRNSTSLSQVEFTPTTQTITYTINSANKSSVIQISIYGTEYVTASIGATGWATFSSEEALDFANATPSGLSAYMVIGTGANKTVTTSAVDNVPGSTGLLLNGTASTTYTIPVLASSETNTTGNLMQACVTETTVNYNDNSSLNYVLVSNAGTAEFQKITNDVEDYNHVTVGAGKAYLALTSDPGAPTLSLFFDNENTGINAVQAEGLKVNGAYYNLNGQRVAQPTKGLYIVNGKKVVVR